MLSDWDYCGGHAFIAALGATIREGLNGEDAYDRSLAWQRSHGTQQVVTDTLQRARHGPPSYNGKHQGWILVALQNAFYQALHAPTFEAGVVETVMGGGDTDTNTAVAGTLLGAIHGARSVPAQWREVVLTCRPQAGIAGIERPRPRAFWPVDGLTLAERLAVLGQRHVGSGH